jgi:high-affinity Fe2+/Pb2+ permease
MNFSGFMDGIVSLARGNTIIAIVIALGLLLFMYRRPKLFFGILFFVLLMAALFYMIATMAGSGSDQKRRLTGQEEEQFDSQ